jgi:hypothetical protein
MGTLGGFASPFGPPPAASSPLASLGLAKPSRDAALPARARAKPEGRAGWAVRPEGPAGSARGCLARTDIDLVRLVNNAG